MNRMQEDDDLKNLFRRLKSRDLQEAPPFDQVYSQPRSHRVIHRQLRVALVALVLVTAILVVMLRGPGPDQPDGNSITGWRSPTDALLKAPGSELLTTLPRFAAPLFPSTTIHREDL